MGKYLHIVLLLLLAAVSCKGPQRIERDDLENIFYEIFLQDQLIRANPELRHQADSSLVYEAIFNKYGYTTDDYLYSLNYYVQEPVRLAKVMDAVAERFSDEARETGEQIRFLNWKKRMLDIWLKEPDTLGRYLPPLPTDSLVLGMEKDSLFVRAQDSLPQLPADSLLYYHPADSLLTAQDSL